MLEGFIIAACLAGAIILAFLIGAWLIDESRRR